MVNSVHNSISSGSAGEILHGSTRYKFGDIFMFRDLCERVYQDPNQSELQKWYKIFVFEDIGSDEFKESMQEIYQVVSRTESFKNRELIVETNLDELAISASMPQMATGCENRKNADAVDLIL